MDIWALLEGENFAGLAILAVHQELALLDYLAVEPDGRGRGIGGPGAGAGERAVSGQDR